MSPLVVAPLQFSELPDFIRIQLASFSWKTSQILYAPSPQTASHALVELQDQLRNGPPYFFQKVIDPNSGEIMSCARWKIYLHGRADQDLVFKGRTALRDGCDDWKSRAKMVFHQKLFQFFLDVIGNSPCYHLDLLMTDPYFSRQGAAQTLIEWGMREADKKGLPIYLESSTMAQPLYERNGFQVVDTLVMDLAEYGGSGIGVETVTIMVRWPSS